MKVKIYRGTHEIGGNCVELTADNGKVLWLDLGEPLSTVNPDVSYTANNVDALIISHPHQDHYGLMENVGTDVPVYIGQVSLGLISATKIFLGKESPKSNFILFQPWKEFIVLNTFKVYPYLMDHSSPEAFAFVIEADGKRLFYSGDFRSTGWKNKLYYKLLQEPPKNIDLFLTEGTMVERSNQKYPTEQSVYEAISTIIKDQENATFVVSSAQNIDRLVSVVKACNSHKKRLIIDIYNAWALEVVHEKSKGLPTIDWETICVYNHPSQLSRISDPKFSDFKDRVIKKDIGNQIFQNPKEFVYFLRCPNQKLIEALLPKGVIKLVYSQYEGYLEDGHKTYCSDSIIDLNTSGKVDFELIHTSGHATLTDIKMLVMAINPLKIVPIHTECPDKMKQYLEKEGFANVEIWEDGKEYLL
ncbi:MAG: hypothetical protein GZ094_00220 [Mariniphaga sp.]|nr:hypothetical protein [Mariniphaga sp.]